MARMTLTREMFIPTNKPNLQVVEFADLGLVAYLYDHEKTGRPVVKAFSGRKAAADFWYVYSTEEKRSAKIAEWVACHQQRANLKQQRKVERAAPHSLKIGDILIDQWGYSMSLVDFYKVVATTKNGLTLQRIGSKPDANREPSNEQGFYGYVVADDTITTGEPFKVRCGSNNSPKVQGHSYAHQWSGEAAYFNWLD